MLELHSARKDWRQKDWVSSAMPPRGQRKAQVLWVAMLKRIKTRKAFTIRELAAETKVSPRYARAYVRILARNGYLVVTHAGRSSHDPAQFVVGKGYREAVAPQIAGGSGGGRGMGLGWRNLLPATVAAVQVRAKARGIIGRTRRAR